jgi:hypothetical protein
VQTGRIFEKDWTAHKLKLAWDSTLTWTIPDGSGGSFTLRDNEVLFVYTPHEAIPEFFAVMRDGESVIGVQNSVGPVTCLSRTFCSLAVTESWDPATGR